MAVESSQLEADRFGSQHNDLTAHLLNIGLIRNTSRNRGATEYQLTPRGVQYLADFEALQHEVDLGYPVERLQSSLPRTCKEQVAFLQSCKESGLQIEPRSMPHVSVLIPTLNEALNIPVVLKNFAEKLPEIGEIIVVDGGTDGTAQVAARLGARVIIQEGVGKGDALRQAFSSGISGDIIVTFDGDGSNRLDEIPELVRAVMNGGDMAKGSRFLKGGGSTDLSRIRKIGNRLFVSLVNLLWSGNYTDLCYGFVAFRKDALMSLAPLLESKYFEIETEICIKARKLGLRTVEVPSIELKRRHGTSKLRGLKDSIRIIRTIAHELMSPLESNKPD